MKKIFLFSIVALVIASCLPQDVQVPQSPLLSTLERKSGLIAYIGSDGNMYVSDQGGGNLAQLTKDALQPQSQGGPFLYYQQPTWSRDGSQVAFASLGNDGTQTEAKLIVANVDDKSVNEIYSSQSEYPIYLYWSPDNANVSFISSSASRQNIILQSVPAKGGERTILDAGSPYYWSWAPDGRVMIVNAGGAATSAPKHLAFLRVDSDIVEQGLDSTPAPFQAPAWSPDGSRIAFAQTSNQENQIIVTDSAGENPQTVGTFTSKTAFAWSNDGSRLAYIDSAEALSSGVFGALHVVDLETSEEIVEGEGVIAFFWSPNGEEIAYFLLLQTDASAEDLTTAAQYILQLHVLDVTTGKSRKLFTYRPTDQFLSILPYFDQYHNSTTIWSPDNNNLVLSFLDNNGNPGIAIVAASGQLEPRLLADGYLAFWSWK